MEPMSAIGTKRTWPGALHMSASGGKADIDCIKGKATGASAFCFAQRLLAHRFAYQRAMAMHADTVAVTTGSAH